MTGLLDQAAAAFEAGRLPQAEMLCQTRLGQSPNDRAALRQLGFVRLANGDSAGALVLLSPLLDTASNDQELLIALGEAAWAVNSAAAAIPYFQRVLSEAPGRVLLRMRVALAQYTAGQSAAACDSFRLVLAAQPENAVALAHFGMASLAAGQAVEAVPALQRATDMLRDDATCACQLGLALRELGRFDEALDALREAVRRGPEEAALRLALGDALFARRDFPAALAELRLAVRLDPAAPLAWAKLGDVENLAGDKKQAVVCYRRAADLQPDDADLQALLGNALFDPESPAAGQAELGRSMSLRWRRPVPPERRMRVGILAAPGFANTPTGGLVDRARFAAAPIFMLDPFHYPCSDIGRSYDVLFNAVSDPDAAPAALAAAERLVPQLGLPVINPPAMIASTARDAIATRLLGIDGLQIPLTRRYARAELHDPQAAFSAFDAAVLVRAAGRHGGQSLVRAESAQAVQAAAAALPPGDVYLTPIRRASLAGWPISQAAAGFCGRRCFPPSISQSAITGSAITSGPAWQPKPRCGRRKRHSWRSPPAISARACGRRWPPCRRGSGWVFSAWTPPSAPMAIWCCSNVTLQCWCGTLSTRSSTINESPPSASARQ